MPLHTSRKNPITSGPPAAMPGRVSRRFEPGTTLVASRAAWPNSLGETVTGWSVVSPWTNERVGLMIDGPSVHAVNPQLSARELAQEFLVHGCEVVAVDAGDLPEALSSVVPAVRSARLVNGSLVVVPASDALLAGLRACPTCGAAAGEQCAGTCRGRSAARVSPDHPWV